MVISQGTNPGRCTSSHRRPTLVAGVASRKEAQQAQLAEKERLQKIPPEAPGDGLGVGNPYGATKD